MNQTIKNDDFKSRIDCALKTLQEGKGVIFADIFSKCLSTPVSNEFCGYWQGNKRVAEHLGA